MNVGDYVRTKDGLITKFEREDDIFYVFDKMISTDKDINKYVKISPNIMDLIEENDYIRTINDTDFRRVYMSYGKLVIYKYDEEIPIETFSNKFIGGIITSEQFSQMEYKVGE